MFRKKLFFFISIFLGQIGFIYNLEQNIYNKNTVYVVQKTNFLKNGSKSFKGFTGLKMFTVGKNIILSCKNKRAIDLANIINKWNDIYILEFKINPDNFYCKFRIKI